MNNRYIRIQGVKQRIRVTGLEQIPEGAEIANANLILKHGDYFLKVTTYLPKVGADAPAQAIGIDFGIKEQITFSNGIAVTYRVNDLKELRKLYQKFSRTQKRSNNRLRIREKLQKEFERINNRKKDIQNKTVSYLIRNYGVVCFQDDNIRAWQRIWGNRILETSLGGVTSILRERVHTPVEVDRFYPSTKLCSLCGSKKSVALNERLYVCESCGAVIDRNHNSARNILFEGLTLLPMERREVKTVETLTYTLAMLEYLNRIPHVEASLVCEAGSLIALA